MQVIFSHQAIADLEAIGEWFLSIDAATAATRVLALRRACEKLAEFPYSGRYLAGYGLRRTVFGSFLIFYRVQGQHIGIARILHGAQDWRSLLRGPL